MELTRAERESILSFNEQDQTASVYTHSAALIRKLGKLAQERPDECALVRVCHDGAAAEYTVPKRWIKVAPPHRRTLSDEQKAALSVRMKQLRAQRTAQYKF